MILECVFQPKTYPYMYTFSYKHDTYCSLYDVIKRDSELLKKNHLAQKRGLKLIRTFNFNHRYI